MDHYASRVWLEHSAFWQLPLFPFPVLTCHLHYRSGSKTRIDLSGQLENPTLPKVFFKGYLNTLVAWRGFISQNIYKPKIYNGTASWGIIRVCISQDLNLWEQVYVVTIPSLAALRVTQPGASPRSGLQVKSQSSSDCKFFRSGTISNYIFAQWSPDQTEASRDSCKNYTQNITLKE